MRFVRRDWVISVVVLSAAAAAQADDPAKKSKAEWDKWRKEVRERVANSRKRVEAQRKAAAKAPAVATTPTTKMPVDRAPSAPTSKPKPTDRQERMARALAYKFAPGMQFAYRVRIDSDGVEGKTRLVGNVYFDVRSISDDRAAIHCIGLLRNARQDSAGKPYVFDPSGDLWLSPLLKVDARAEGIGGRPDPETALVPNSIKGLFRLRRLFFVELPRSDGDHMAHQKSLQIFRTYTGGLAGVRLETQNATETFRVEAASAGESASIITRKAEIRSADGPPIVWAYNATSRFDRTTGMIVQTRGDLTIDETGNLVRKSVFEVDALTGAELDAARAEAGKVLRRRPADLHPFELFRQPIEVDSLRAPWLTSLARLKPGVDVIHFRDDNMSQTDAKLRDFDYKFYLAKVLEISEIDKAVRIRYDGSKEEFAVPYHKLLLRSEATLKSR